LWRELFRRRALLTVGLIIMLSAKLMGGVELYVSPLGDDTSPGTKTEPLKTLEAARDAIRERKDVGGTVWLRDGVHVRLATFQLNEDDSGTSQTPVVYRSVAGESARLVGGKLIPSSAFQAVTDPAILQRFSSSATSNILQVDLKKQGISKLGEMTPRGIGRPEHPAHLEVFFDGQPLTLAQWPSEGWVKVTKLPQSKHLTGSGGKRRGKDTDRFFYSGDRPKRWENSTDIWVYGYWMYDWADAYLKVKTIDTASRMVTLEPPQSVFGYRENRRFRFLNVLEELDGPGEYYLDRDSGLLYLWPPGPIGNAEVMVSILDTPMVTMNDVTHVTLRGLTLECARGGGIRVYGGANVNVAGCTIRNLGQDGVLIQGGTDHVVASCDIYNLGEAGVMMSGGDRQTLEPGRHSAINNHIHHFSRWLRTYQQAVRLSGVGHRVAHNYVHDAPHAAISFSGNDHIIEFNRIANVAQDSGDVGAIYTGRDWSMRGTVIRHNFIHDTVSRMGHGTMAVYLDDLASGTEIVGNVFVRAGKCVFIGGGRDVIVENNIFMDSEVAVHVDNRGKGWAGKLIKGGKGSWGMFVKLKLVPYDRPPYTTRYPELVDFLNQDPLQAKNNVIARNIKIGRGSFLHLRQVDRKYMKVGENLVDQDSGFVDAAPIKAKFQLRTDSPALKLGFKPIPFDKIGLYQDKYRKVLPSEGVGVR